MLFADDIAAAGLWKPEPGLTRYPGLELHARETIVVLVGSARIEIEDAPTLDLSAGDLASMPEGAVTTWLASPDFREVWVYS